MGFFQIDLPIYHPPSQKGTFFKLTSHLLANLGWVDFDLGCSTAQPISHQPRQNQAEGGTAKIKVNPTKVRQEMGHPV